MHEHARAAILAIGDELMLGQSLDTNSCWLADRLTTLGIIPVQHITVGDDAPAITDSLRRLMAIADLVITTGGLGPTADDLTRQAVAAALGQPLVEDAGALAHIENYFRARGRKLPAINRCQALRPRDAAIIPNPRGTAPGLSAAQHAPACDVFCLPGPPREMQPMFNEAVAPRLRPPRNRIIRVRLLHTHGLGESDVASRLGDLMDRSRMPLVGTTASQATVTCRIRYEGPHEGIGGQSPDALLDTTARAVHGRLDPFIYGEGDHSLQSSVIDLLRVQSRTLAIAESCTGGMLGAMLTEVPGASDVFYGGWITYANAAKEHHLAVPGDILAKSGEDGGAVSRACALAMANGALAKSGAQEALSITGIAGPGGESPGKPVGTVWIALASRTATGVDAHARRFLFPGERAHVRTWSCRTALGMLRLKLIGRPELPLLGQQA